MSSNNDNVELESEMRMVAHFMARKFMQDIEQKPEKESFIEFRPPNDTRKAHSLNFPWDTCNAFVKVSWDPKWLVGLRIIFGAFSTRKDEDGDIIYEKIAPQAQELIETLQKKYDIRTAYPFPPKRLNTEELESIFNAIINEDNLIYVAKTW